MTMRSQIGAAFFAFILIGANDGATGVLLPSLRAQYGVDKGTIGLLFLAATTGYLVSAFVSGLLVERLGPRLFLTLGATTFLCGSALLALVPPFVAALGTFLLLGFGV